MSKPNGGPAFPLIVPAVVFPDGSVRDPYVLENGLSLRDYFAAHAPIALNDIEETRYIGHNKFAELSLEERFKELAELRGNYADAMIAERSK